VTQHDEEETNMSEEEEEKAYTQIDKLEAHGINMADINKLKGAGICTVLAVLMRYYSTQLSLLLVLRRTYSISRESLNRKWKRYMKLQLRLKQWDIQVDLLFLRRERKSKGFLQDQGILIPYSVRLLY
jgi:hypothetical protein